MERQIYVVVAEYEPSEDKRSGALDMVYCDLLGAFEDKERAEGFAARKRKSGEYGTFPSDPGWSSDGWWIEVRVMPFFEQRQPWGIPRRANAAAIKRRLV